MLLVRPFLVLFFRFKRFTQTYYFKSLKNPLLYSMEMLDSIDFMSHDENITFLDLRERMMSFLWRQKFKLRVIRERFEKCKTFIRMSIIPVE